MFATFCYPQHVFPDLSEPLATVYKSGNVEQGWYSWWEDNGFFRRAGAEESFVMAFPPPNVTGFLHLGHALTCSIQDAFARWSVSPALLCWIWICYLSLYLGVRIIYGAVIVNHSL